MLDRLAEAGVYKVVVNTFHFAQKLVEHLEPRKDDHPIITFSREDELEEPLETEGGLIKALPMMGEGIILTCNADAIWFDETAISVSYTHLDVYKRQVHAGALQRSLSGITCAAERYTLGPGAAGDGGHECDLCTCRLSLWQAVRWHEPHQAAGERTGGIDLRRPGSRLQRSLGGFACGCCAVGNPYGHHAGTARHDGGRYGACRPARYGLRILQSGQRISHAYCQRRDVYKRQLLIHPILLLYVD